MTLVSTPPHHPPSPPVGSLLLLALAVVFYIPALLAIWLGGPEGDPATFSGEARYSQAWAMLYALLFGILLWIALGVLVLLAGLKGHLTCSWTAAAGIFYPLAAGATFAAAQVCFTWPGGWSVLVPALLPPLLALYALAARVPLLGADWPLAVPAAALGSAMVVAVAAIPLALIDKIEFPANLAAAQRRWESVFDQRHDALMKAASQWEARINNLGPNSPLEAWLEYVNGSGSSGPLHQQALDGARHVDRRQAEVVKLIEDGRIRQLTALWQLDIAATPALCAAYDQGLRRLSQSDEVYELKVGEDLERQLPNLKFLAAANCDLETGLSAAEARVRKLLVVYPDGDGHEHWLQFQAALGALHHTR